MAVYSLPDYRQRIATDRKILKAADYRILAEAQDLLGSVREQLRQLREQNETIFEQQKQAGYEAGLAEAKMERAELIFSATAQAIEYVSSVERAMVEIVMMVLRRVLEDYDDAETVARLTQQGLQRFRDQTRVKLHIPAGADAQRIRDRLGRAMAPAAASALAEIIEIPDMNSGACRLESDMGSVEADPEVFLQALESALRERFAAQS